MRVENTRQTCVFDSVRVDEYLRLHRVHDHAAPLGPEGIEIQLEVTGPFCHQLSLVFWTELSQTGHFIG